MHEKDLKQVLPYDIVYLIGRKLIELYKDRLCKQYLVTFKFSEISQSLRCKRVYSSTTNVLVYKTYMDPAYDCLAFNYRTLNQSTNFFIQKMHWPIYNLKFDCRCLCVDTQRVSHLPTNYIFSTTIVSRPHF